MVLLLQVFWDWNHSTSALMFPFATSFILNIASWYESEETCHSCNKLTKRLQHRSNINRPPTKTTKNPQSSGASMMQHTDHLIPLKTLYTKHTHCLPVSANLVISLTKSLKLNYTVLGLRLGLQMSSFPQRPRWIPPDDRQDKSCLNQLSQVLGWGSPQVLNI